MILVPAQFENHQLRAVFLNPKCAEEAPGVPVLVVHIPPFEKQATLEQWFHTLMHIRLIWELSESQSPDTPHTN